MANEPTLYGQVLYGKLRTLFAAFGEATGLKQTRISRLVSKNPVLLREWEAGRFNVGVFDDVLAKFSALWPEEAEWPEGILRPEPAADITDVARAEVDFALVKLRAKRAA